MQSSPPASRGLGPPAGLVIRATRVSDCEAIAAISAMPGFRAGTLRLPFQTSDITRRFIESQGETGLGLVAELGGLVVGSAGWQRSSGRRQHAASIGMGVHDDYVGRGIGAALLAALVDAADNWYALRRLELTVYPDNAPAIRLYQRFGFEIEGTLRDYAFSNGRYVDAIAMSRIRVSQ